METMWANFIKLVTLLATPVGCAVLLSIVLTQVVKAVVNGKRVGKKKAKLSEVALWGISWLLTTVIFPVVCLGLGVPMRGTNFGVGFVCGALGPSLVKAYKMVTKKFFKPSKKRKAK